MKNPNKQRSTITNSLMRGTYVLFIRLLIICLPALIGLCMWGYIIPQMTLSVLLGDDPNRGKVTLTQLVKEAKERVAESERLRKGFQKRSSQNYRGSPKQNPSSSTTAKE
jgi:hypothetical protein